VYFWSDLTRHKPRLYRLSWEASVYASISNVQTFDGTQRFITVYTIALHW
jgi:hypothetical protein